MSRRWQRRLLSSCYYFCTKHNVLGILALFLLGLFYLATQDVARSISPQGCRMSWMSPSYIQMTEFDTSWTRLGRRYSLWLYREWGWDADVQDVGKGIPVLFVPGNAGSSRQVRSIASSATRQYFVQPGQIAKEFTSASSVRVLDFYAAEFNEDLSAFHGPTLEAQIEYTAGAVEFILSKYPEGTKIILMGHSMGGIVTTALLSRTFSVIHSGNASSVLSGEEAIRKKAEDTISVVVTMSTPHRLPPARFDQRIEMVYEVARKGRTTSNVEVLSICGGVADGMIVSEACALPLPSNSSLENNEGKTVFSSALEGAWTGVGHREMVWCHQVRWRVARAALEIGAQNERAGYRMVLDRWFRDGSPGGVGATPAGTGQALDTTSLIKGKRVEVLPPEGRLVIKNPGGGDEGPVYLLPVPPPRQSTGNAGETTFVLYVSQGSIPPVAPHTSLALTAWAYICSGPAAETCESWPLHLEDDKQNHGGGAAVSLKLIPNPVPGMPFPVPDEGTDESEGVVVFEGRIPPAYVGNGEYYVGVMVGGKDGRGWVIGGFIYSPPANDVGEEGRESNIGLLGLVFRGAISLQGIKKSELKATYRLPSLLQHALLVYRVEVDKLECPDALLCPLISQTSQPSETHYFPLSQSSRGESSRRILLHTHAVGPYVLPASAEVDKGMSFDVYSSGECVSEKLRLKVDWIATLGRWPMRYAVTLVSWVIGIVAVILWRSFGVEGNVPPLSASLGGFCRQDLWKLMIASMILTLFPLSRSLFLGNGGEIAFAVIGPILTLTATGLVIASWSILQIILAVLGFVYSCGRGKAAQSVPSRFNKRTSIVSMTLIFAIVFLFVPWQVAYLGCWIIHLWTCATSSLTSHDISPSSEQRKQEREHHNGRSDDDPRDSSSNEGEESVPLVVHTSSNGAQSSAQAIDGQERRRSEDQIVTKIEMAYNYNTSMLLLMTWLLPLTAPVLVVWVRTLWTAGLTTPFDGDHFFLNIAPFLLLVEFCSSGDQARVAEVLVLKKNQLERYVNVRWGFAVLFFVAFLAGPRWTYLVFDVARLAVAAVAVVRIGPVYWHSTRAYSSSG